MGVRGKEKRLKIKNHRKTKNYSQPMSSDLFTDMLCLRPMILMLLIKVQYIISGCGDAADKISIIDHTNYM